MLQELTLHLPKAVVDVIRLSMWLAILVIIFVPLERLFAARPEKIFRKGIVTDLGYYFLSNLLPAVLLSAPIALLAWTVQRAVPGGFLAWAGALPLWQRAWPASSWERSAITGVIA